MTSAVLPVVGIALEIAGAVTLAWTLSRNSGKRILEAVPISRRGYGHPALARQMAASAAEARYGVALLVAGFALQSTAYLFAGVAAGLGTWGERVLAVGLVAATWFLAYLGYRLFVPWMGRRIWSDVQRRDAAQRN